MAADQPDVPDRHRLLGTQRSITPVRSLLHLRLPVRQAGRPRLRRPDPGGPGPIEDAQAGNEDVGRRAPDVLIAFLGPCFSLEPADYAVGSATMITRAP